MLQKKKAFQEFGEGSVSEDLSIELFQLMDLCQKAYGNYQESLKLYRQLNRPHFLATALNNLASLYEEMGQAEKSLPLYQEAEQLLQQVGNPSSLATFYINLGWYYQQLNQEEKAILFWIKGMDFLNKAAALMGSGREAYIRSQLPQYHSLLFQFFSATEQTKRRLINGFQILQQYKGYGFLTRLSEIEIELDRYIEPNFLKKKRKLTQKISLLNKEYSQAIGKQNTNSNQLQQLKTQIQEYENKLGQVIDKMREGNKAYASITYPKPATVEEIQNLLEEDQLFLEYYCSPLTSLKSQKSEGYTYCLLLGKKCFKVLNLGKTKQISKELAYFRQLIWESSQEDVSLEEYKAQAIKLYHILLEPLLGTSLNAKKNLIIAPDGPLHLLAFDALCIPSEKESKEFFHLNYVLDSYQISYRMSATVYRELLEKSSFSSTPSFFGIGSPDFKKKSTTEEKQATRKEFSPLPETKKELESIVRLFSPNQCKILLGREANEANLFLTDLSNFTILHFATHGLIDLKYPMNSALAFTVLNTLEEKELHPQLAAKGWNPLSCSDGFLRVRDIFELKGKLKAKLAVLSACETGVGKIVQGDGIIGLTRAFQFSGVQNVIVSLWAVSDDSTRLLMEEFYQHLLTETKTFNLTESLHKAKKTLRDSEKYAAPFYWAPFVLHASQQK